LIARRSSTAAVGAGTADVDDRVKGNGSRLFGAAEDRPPAARASPPARSGKRRGPPALRLSSHRLPKNGKRPPLKSRAPAETAPRQLSETSPPTNETRRPTLDAGALNRRPPAVERAEPYTDSGTRHTSASCYDSIGQSNPPYLIQISTSQRKSALLRRRVSARGVQRTEIQESTIEGRGTRHEKPPNRSLTRCQTADVRGERQGPGAKDAPRRDLSNDTSIAVFTQGGKNSTAEKPTKNRPFSAENFKVRCDDASNKGERRAWERVRFTKTRDAGPRTNGAITYRAPSYARARSVRTSPFEPFERDISKTARRRRSESKGDP
jgi:hypothetical protein